MKYKPGNTITVKNVPGGIRNGDALVIQKIGVDVDPDCYVVATPHDDKAHILHENDVELSTNAERIRSMDDSALARFMFAIVTMGSPDVNGKKLKTLDDCKAWLKESVPLIDLDK